MLLRMRRRFAGAFVACVLGLLLASKVAWTSGAVSSLVVSRRYQIAASDASFAIGEREPPSQASLDRRAATMRDRVCAMMPLVDHWLAEETAANVLAPVYIDISTALVERPRKDLDGGPLSRASLVVLPACWLKPHNLLVEVGVALRVLPGRTAREALGKRLCARLVAAKLDGAAPALVAIVPVVKSAVGPRMMLETAAFVPEDRVTEVVAQRKALFDRAVASTSEAIRSFVAAHGGAQVTGPDAPGSRPGRFFTDLPFGGFDVRYGLVGGQVETAEQLDVPLKNAIYRAWLDAALPPQASLESLLRSHAP